MTTAWERYRALAREELEALRQAGLFKDERRLSTAQGARVRVGDAAPVVNLCANNYLGLSSHPAVLAAARAALDRWGYGLSSVRFICGTQDVHRELEARLSAFLGTEDTILFSSCFDANGGVFEALFGAEDAILSDALNHASLIDGIRLCKARRLRYANDDLGELESRLRETADARFRVVVTDGVFSMDGTVARLDAICALADRYDALVLVDDSHGTGVLGARGRGTHEHRGVVGRVDLLTGTLGKALGGASGGYVSGRRELVALLRQRARPYLFSNSLSPVIAHATLAVLDLLEPSNALRDRLADNTRLFRAGMRARGFSVPAGEHPIVPILLGDARRAHAMADRLLQRGVYVVGFSYPVVPRDRARIRVQLSAAHDEATLHQAMDAFAAVRDELEG